MVIYSTKDGEFMEKFKNLRMNYNHCHSEYSNIRMLDCIVKIDKLIDKAIEKGTGLVVTDHESISGSVKAIQHIKSLKSKGKLPKDFRFAMGDEIYLVDSIEEVRDNYVGGVTKFYHFLVMAKDLEGFRLLQKITSKASENSFKTGKMERTPISKDQLRDIIRGNKGHLRCSTSCLGSEFSSLILEYSKDDSRNVKMKIHNFLQYCFDLFGKENVFVELQPSLNVGDEQEIYNVNAMKIAKAYGLTTHITTDVHYMEKEDRAIHEAFLLSREGDRELGDFYSTTYFMTPMEIFDKVKHYITEEEFVELIENTKKFVEDVEFYDLYHETIVPEVINFGEIELKHIFQDYYEQYEYIKKYAFSDSIQDKAYFDHIETGFIELEEEFNEVNICRINDELRELYLVSKKMDQHVSAYYNLTKFIIDECVLENGLVGTGRGSMGAWYTLYLIGLHNVNPILYDIPLWRHLKDF